MYRFRDPILTVWVTFTLFTLISSQSVPSGSLRTSQREPWQLQVDKQLDLTCSKYIKGTVPSDKFKWTANYAFTPIEEDHLLISVIPKWRSIGQLQLQCTVYRVGETEISAKFNIRLQPLSINTVSPARIDQNNGSYFVIILGVSAAASILLFSFLLAKKLKTSGDKLNLKLDALVQKRILTSVSSRQTQPKVLQFTNLNEKNAGDGSLVTKSFGSNSVTLHNRKSTIRRQATIARTPTMPTLWSEDGAAMSSTNTGYSMSDKLSTGQFIASQLTANATVLTPAESIHTDIMKRQFIQKRKHSDAAKQYSVGAKSINPSRRFTVFTPDQTGQHTPDATVRLTPDQMGRLTPDQMVRSTPAHSSYTIFTPTDTLTPDT